MLIRIADIAIWRAQHHDKVARYAELLRARSQAPAIQVMLIPRYKVVDGNHRVAAAIAAGFQTIEAEINCPICVT